MRLFYASKETVDVNSTKRFKAAAHDEMAEISSGPMPMIQIAIDQPEKSISSKSVC